MRINVNGTEMTTEEFEAWQQSQEEKIECEYLKLREVFDCNYAVISPQLQCNCIFDGQPLFTADTCLQCKAYNNKVYIAEEV